MPKTEPSFYDLWVAIAENPNLKPHERTAMERELVGQWGGENIKAMCVSLLHHDRYSILQTPDATFVTKFRDCLEVLNRDEVFSVSGYAERMVITTGPFMLGMQEGAEYQHDHSVVQLSMPFTDLTAIRRWVQNYSKELVAGLTKNKTTIDAVADVAYMVPPKFVGHYFGVPGPEHRQFLDWLEILAAYIFNYNGGELKTLASSAGLEFQTYLNRLILQRQKEMQEGKHVDPDVLTRMLQAEADPSNSLDVVGIRRNLGGLSIGCTMPPCGTIAYALDGVMSLNDRDSGLYDPDMFETIIQIASDNDETLLENCMMEAARLSLPEPPSVFRTATQDYYLGKGTLREKLIRKGDTVVVVPSSAMMDSEMIDCPKEFRINRPDWNYVMFGQGMHECLGKKIGKILVAEAVRPVLALKNIRRVKGKAGGLLPGTGIPAQFYPGHMVLEFDEA